VEKNRHHRQPNNESRFWADGVLVMESL
jgi:hypothetical protein